MGSYDSRQAMRAELGGWGFHHIGDERLNGFLNEAATDFYTEELWPWRLTIASSQTLPYTIPGNGIVRQVVADGGLPLIPMERDALQDRYGDQLADAGTASYYFVEAGVITPYPASGTATFDIHVYDRYPWASGQAEAAAEADVLAVPPEWRSAVMKRARVLAHQDERQWEEATVVHAEYQAQLERIRGEDGREQRDEPPTLELTEMW